MSTDLPHVLYNPDNKVLDGEKNRKTVVQDAESEKLNLASIERMKKRRAQKTEVEEISLTSILNQ